MGTHREATISSFYPPHLRELPAMDLLQACCDSRQLLDTILSCIRHPVLVTRIDGTIEAASPSVTAVLGFTPDELKNKSVSVIFTPEDLTYLFPNLFYLAGKNESFEGELLLTRKNETRFFAFVRLESFFDSHFSASRVVISIEDIDKRKRLEKAFKEVQYEDLVKLAAGIAHELRNPLVSIGGFADRLHKECRTSQKHDTYYDYITTNLKKVEELVKKIEFFAHLPNPCFTEEPIRDLIQAAFEPFRLQIQELDIAPNIELGEIRLRVDKELVVKAFSMVIENALDVLTKEGEISIRSATKGNEYEVYVRDTGCGIAPGDIPHIFNPFFSTKTDGAGIGLAVVKRIMESQGGAVEVTSEGGKGTTVRLVLPLERRRSIRVAPLERPT